MSHACIHSMYANKSLSEDVKIWIYFGSACCHAFVREHVAVMFLALHWPEDHDVC